MYETKKMPFDLDLKNKKVIVRVDFNVPIKDGKITDDKRIKAALPTIKYLLDQNCAVICLSHLSRIKSLDDIKSNKKSLKPVALKLKELFPSNNVIFEPSLDFDKVKQTASKLQNQEILLLENTRYYDVNDKGETIKWESKNNSELAKFWASLADAFINDAFGTAHRAHASNAGIAQNIKDSCIGFLVLKEITNISKAIDHPTHPYVAILGGAKVSDKLKVINNLVNKADKVIVCGGMAYTFWAAQGYDVGKSICEPDMYPMVLDLLKKAKKKLVVTVDSVCTKEFKDIPGTICKIGDYKGMEGVDIGPETTKLFDQVLSPAKTVIWNGPAGVFEFKNFSNGTFYIAHKLKELTSKGAYTLVGGGDSAAAITLLGFKEKDYSFVSTGGGASLALIEGSPLIGIDPISNK